MKLSAHFSLAEFTRSDVATRLGISNQPSEAEIENLQLLCDKVLEPIRVYFNKPVRVNSGFRSVELNKAINPATSTSKNLSQHCYGQAADIEIEGVSNYELATWIANNIPEYDQLILEFYVPGNPNSGWVHISYALRSGKPQRKQLLTAHRVNGRLTYSPGLLA